MEHLKYGGMTVNERLHVSGYSDEFDKATKNKDVETVTTILRKIEVGESDIATIINQFYGLL